MVTGEDKTLAQVNHPRHKSIGGFFRDVRVVIRLLGETKTQNRRLTRLFKESVNLTVTFANNCLF